jgi:hypothetical protein
MCLVRVYLIRAINLQPQDYNGLVKNKQTNKQKPQPPPQKKTKNKKRSHLSPVALTTCPSHGDAASQAVYTHTGTPVGP